MSVDVFRRALERVEATFLNGQSAEAALARREAGSVLAGDERLVRARCCELISGQAPDGSWAGDVLLTATALVELAELEWALVPGRDPVELEPDGQVPAGLAWLAALRDGPGRFGEDCSEAWHRQGLCSHVLTGFHAPPAGRGSVDADTLVVASARATRAALAWGQHGPALDAHLDSLHRVISHWAWPGGEPLLQPRSGVAALGAVLEAWRQPEDVVSAAEGIACLVRTQRADGTWHGVGLYDALDTLLLGVARGYRVPEVDAALLRAAELLAISQKADGSWGRQTTVRQPLTAWRVLRHTQALAQEARTPIFPG